MGIDRIAQEATPLGTIDYTYDAVGKRETMTVAGQPVVNYDYYDNNGLENVRQVVNGVEQRFNFVYDDGGRRSFLKYLKGADIEPTMQTTYDYDDANRLLTLQHLDLASQVFESLTYTYDANGNRISMNRPSVNLPLANPASNTSYNEANHMLSFNDKRTTYDNNGNMETVTNTCGTTTYTWDVRNRLVAINGYNTDCSSLTASFRYDALGRRNQKTISGLTTQYLYDGIDIIQEQYQNGTVKANYIRTFNIDEPLMRIKTDGTIRIYQTDALGSVIALTDDSGVLKTTYSYDPFGNMTMSGETSDNPFQYTGRENDDTGLYYYRYRFYSPQLQRFISEDPNGLAGGINLYAYVGNKPVNFVDPLGLSQQDEITKGSYRYIKYPGDTFHGGEHWHVYDRKTGKLFGRMTPAGEVLTGSIPKTALKIFKNVMKIGGVVLGVVLELADPADAGGPEDMLPLQPVESKKCH